MIGTMITWTTVILEMMIITAIMIRITSILITMTMTRTMVFMKTEIMQKMEKEGNYDGIDYNNNGNDENGDDNYYNDGNISVTIIMTTK